MLNESGGRFRTATERVHGNDCGDIQPVRFPVTGLDNRARSLAVPGKADFGGIDHAMEFTAGFIILLEDPHQSSQYVAFLDRTLIGGDDDIRAIKDPFNQNRFVPFRGRPSGDIISAPIIGPDDSQRLTVAGT